MDSIEVIVIGAGVVGLACARALAQAGRDVMVIEAQPGIGQGISSRNSEVIHAGLYYEPGSLKARLCVRGRDLMYAYCAERGLAHRRCGKLVVATRDEERPALEAIHQRALANGVSGLRWLSGTQAQALEPALHSVAALLSADTGIVDSHGLMLALQGDAEAAGAMCVFNTRVVAADLTRHGAEVHTTETPAATPAATPPSGSLSLSARWVINGAGLDAPAVAAAMHGLPPHAVPAAHYAKGHYFALSGRAPFTRLIYPVPEPGGLGVHLTLDLGGQAKFGPDVEWIAKPDHHDYRVDPQRAADFSASIRRYWPGLPDEALQPAYAGVRPKLHGPGGHADFRIDGPAEHGAPGLVQLLGIESPGLTASMAIAEEVARIVTRG